MLHFKRNNKEKIISSKKINKAHVGQKSYAPRVNSSLFTEREVVPETKEILEEVKPVTKEISNNVTERRSHRTTSRYVRGGLKVRWSRRRNRTAKLRSRRRNRTAKLRSRRRNR